VVAEDVHEGTGQWSDTDYIDDEFVFPMSLAQERLWFIERLSTAGALFHLSTVTRLSRAVDAGVLESALNEIVRRHEALRTTFDLVDGVPSQIVHPYRQLAVPLVDLTHLKRSGREAAALELAETQAERPFDLRVGPLLRATVFELGAGDRLLAVTIHHLVSDGWSMGLFWHELTLLSGALTRGEPSPLPELETQYADYAVWQRSRLTGAVLAEEMAFWRTTLAEPSPVLELPTDRPRPPTQSFSGAVHEASLPADLVQRAGRLAHDEGATVFMVLLAGLQSLLHRYTGAEDIAVGTYTAGREHPETEAIIGFFLNTLVLRGNLAGEPTFREVVRRARVMALDAYAHQNLPFATLVQELHPDRDPSRNPLFQVLFQMLNVPTLERLTPKQRDAAVHTRRTASAFDLSLALEPDGRGGLDLEVEYATDLFDADTVARLAEHFVTLLGSALENPDRAVHELDLMSQRERDRVLAAGQGEVVQEPRHPDLSSMFEAQVAAHPEAPALLTPDGTVSYGALDAAVARLAAELWAVGVRRQDPVVVWLPRQGAHVTALLAALRLGAVYVPVAADSPGARVIRIVEDVDASALVTTEGLAGSLEAHSVPVLIPGVDDSAGSRSEAPSTRSRKPVRSRPDEVAYIIFTSGSTGHPKGVEVPHRQVLNRLRWMWRCHPFEEGEVACHKTSISFVDSLWEILGSLLDGVPALVLPEELVRDPAALITALADASVTRIWLVPSLLTALLDTEPDLGRRLPRLRFWVSSGEALPVALSERFAIAHPEATLYNIYGTSEVWDATWWVPPAPGDAAPRWRTPLGKPIDNVVIRVLDAHGQLVPTGVQGELFVGGAGLARAYLGDEALTAERFVPDPLDPGRRLYRTFDIVRWLPNGDLEFVIRNNGLVKINGYRVDPAEVEQELARLPGIRTAAVVAADERGLGTRLAAYVVPEPGLAPSAEVVRQDLARALPRYMLPAEIAVLDELPHTVSGKLDRRALPSLQASSTAGHRKLGPPRNDVERAISQVWGEVLRTEVGREDNFFDLGGHSLLLVEVRERLLRMFSYDLSITDMFRYPTVAALARHCLEQEESKALASDRSVGSAAAVKAR
jgi:amino acid adenylation domain-containing protein